jgi:hypothetical protein
LFKTGTKLPEAKALKARPVKAMGATHGYHCQICVRVLAENTSIEKIRVRQNGSTVIFLPRFHGFF